MEFRVNQELENQLDLLKLPPMTVVRSSNGWPIIVRGDGLCVDRHGDLFSPEITQGHGPYTIIALTDFTKVNIDHAYKRSGFPANTVSANPYGAEHGV